MVKMVEMVEVIPLSKTLKASYGDSMHLDEAKAMELSKKGMVRIKKKKNNQTSMTSKAFNAPPKNRMMQPVQIKATFTADYRSQKKKKNKVIVVIPIHKRVKITRQSVTRLKEKQIEPVTIVLVGDTEIERQVAQDLGVIFAGYWNSPLAWKLQAGIAEARNHNPQALMIAGSDDWYTDNWTKEGLSAIQSGANFTGASTYYFWDQKSNAVIHWTADHFGSGEMVSAAALDVLDWSLYDDRPIEKKLDTHRRKSLAIIGVEKHNIDNIIAMGIRGDWDTLHSWDDIVGRGDLVAKKIDNPKQWLINNGFMEGVKDETARPITPLPKESIEIKTPPLDVLMVAQYDWANVGHTMAKSLQSVGINAEICIEHQLSFGYIETGQIYTQEEVKQKAEKAKILQYMHSEKAYGIQPQPGQKTVVFHGGTQYRQKALRMSQKFNSIVDVSIIQTGDLLGLGANKEVWILPPVDTGLIQPVYTDCKNRKIQIAHYPHKPEVKGTPGILNAINNLKASSIGDKFDWIYSDEKVSWTENLKRISECDIYIEACQKDQKGKKYGEWGITALEAAALGKIVVTHFLSLEKYKKEYGACALCVANNPKQIESVLYRLLAYTPEEIFALQKKTRLWAETYHGLEAVGTRLKEKVYKL